MDLPVYYVKESSDHTYFEFDSVGKRGTIRKYVQFKQYVDKQGDLWNDHFYLTLGDIVDKKHIVNRISDNGDIIMVMATVTRIIQYYLTTYPDRIVVFEGIPDPETNINQRNHLYSRILYRHIEEFNFLKIIARIGGEQTGKYFELTPFMTSTFDIPEYEIFFISNKTAIR
ncbi:hypothetical protein GCM10028806_34050 [Spirosoma terrae]|uniref:Uncharacterized protein n=1 Tax=Spirosoma terrae TaxID=1968276 RepID=A0A6L9LB88_9BACT|nr:hypothetical protein [Spirosoma terrae]NDU95718.1 hypothetical protein [Spirosoma terrae]